MTSQGGVAMTETELVSVKGLDVVAVFTTTGKIDEILRQIEEKVTGIVPDVSTQKGRREIASLAYKVAQSKTVIDSLGKDLVYDWKNKAKKVDESRKYARDYLDALKDRVREPLTLWEQEEEERKAREEAEKQYMADWEQAIADNILFDRIKELERKEAELARIEAERVAKEKAEAEELERKRLEQERIEREKRIVQEAKEKADREAKERIERERFEAEQRAILAEQKRIADIAAERAKAEADRAALIRAQIEKEREEKERIAREKAIEAARVAKEKAEEEARIANKNHRKKINNDALQSLVGIGVPEVLGKKIIVAIASGEIRHVTIRY